MLKIAALPAMLEFKKHVNWVKYESVKIPVTKPGLADWLTERNIEA